MTGYHRSVGSENHPATAAAPSMPGMPPRCRNSLPTPSGFRGIPPPSPHTTYWGYLSQGHTHLDLITKPPADKQNQEEKEQPDFEVLIYRDSHFLNYSDAYLEDLRTLIDNNAVLRITDGRYDEPRKTFKFQLNGEPMVLPLNDPDITGITLFREAFGPQGDVLQGRGTKCGSFSFGFYVFDFSKDSRGKYLLDEKDKKLLKEHRIYLYRDRIRVYPYGDADDDWLQTDMYRGTKAAGMFLSNDQVVGFVNITQKDNPELRDKTNREGLIEIGDATSDFRYLLQIFLAWVRKKPYEQYRIKTRQSKDVEIVKKGQVRAGLDIRICLPGRGPTS